MEVNTNKKKNRCLEIGFREDEVTRIQKIKKILCPSSISEAFRFPCG